MSDLRRLRNELDRSLLAFLGRASARNHEDAESQRVESNAAEPSTPRRLLGTRRAKVVCGALLSVMVMLLWLPIRADSRGVTASVAQSPAMAEVVARFAPEVRLHPEERYFPSSVDWYLERTEVHAGEHGALGDLPTLMGSTFDPSQKLMSETIATRVEDRLDAFLRESTLGKHFLKIDKGHHEGELASRGGELESAKTYVHLRERAGGEEGLEIQYWFFYPYSGPVLAGPAGGAHEGDWEHITVRLDASLDKVEKVFFAAHDREGTWVSAEDVQFVEGSHPVVYSARYGHASYPSAGIQSRGMLPADRTADGGETWQTWGNIKIIADPSGPRKDIAWLAYAGRWGKTGVLFSGPRGPVFQRYWTSET